jgi:hypothetical protein
VFSCSDASWLCSSLNPDISDKLFPAVWNAAKNRWIDNAIDEPNINSLASKPIPRLADPGNSTGIRNPTSGVIDKLIIARSNMRIGKDTPTDAKGGKLKRIGPSRIATHA